MASCVIINNKIQESLKKKFDRFDGLSENFLDYVNSQKETIRKFYDKFPDEEFQQIVNEFLNEKEVEGDNRFPSISTSNIVEEVARLGDKNNIGVAPSFIIKNDNLGFLFQKAQSGFDYFQNSLKRNVIKMAFVNKEKGTYVLNQSDLNNYILVYKNELFNTLKKYMNREDLPNLYNDDFTPNIEAYNELMGSIEKEGRLKKSNLTVDPTSFDERTYILDPYNAMIILNNFDYLIESSFKQIIAIDQNFEGVLENGFDQNKYSLDIASIQTAFWKNDTDEAHDASKYTSKITQMLSETIPMIDEGGKVIEGEFLGPKKLYKICALIKNAEMEAFVDNKGFTPFMSDPVGRLKFYLKNRHNYQGLRSNDLIARSLYKYLYNDDSLSGKQDISLETIQNSTIYMVNGDKRFENSGNLTNELDLISLFAFEIAKNSPVEYRNSKIGESSSVNLTSQDEVTGIVRSMISSSIRNNLDLSISDNPYTIKYITIGGESVKIEDLSDISNLSGDKIDSDEFKDYFWKISGLTLNKDLKDAINKNLIGEKNRSYYKVIIDLVRHIKHAADLEVKALIKDEKSGEYENYFDTNLMGDGSYTTFAAAFVKNIPKTIFTTFEDSKGNLIPVYRLSNMMTNDLFSINEYGFSDNLFANNRSLLSNYKNNKYGLSTAIRLEGYAKDLKSNKKASEFTEQESFFASFFSDFVHSNLDSDTFATQIAGYSDKSSIMLKIINMKGEVLIDGVKKEFGKLSTEEILKLHQTLQKEYYNRITNKVIDDWEIVIGKSLTKGKEKEEIEKYLKNQTTDSIYTRILELNNSGVKVDIVNELHFSVYDKTLKLNRNLFWMNDNFSSEEKFKNFNKSQQRIHLDKVKKYDYKIFNLDNFRNGESELTTIFQRLLGSDYTKFKEFTESEDGDISTIHLVKKIKGNTIEYGDFSIIEDGDDFELNPLLERYLSLTNLVKDQYLGLTVKHQYLHPGKVSLSATMEEENTARVTAMAKRMVILPATLENYQQNLINGIPKTYKIAVVDDSSLPVFNYNGSQKSINKKTGELEDKDQEIHDGSAWVNPFMSILEQYSLPAKGIKGTKKPIGHHAGDGYAMLLKYAQFPITNELVRNSNNSEYSMDNIMKKMNNINWNTNTLKLDITKNFIGGDFKPKHATENPFFIRGDKYYKVEQLSKSPLNDQQKNDSLYRVLLVEVDETGKVNNGQNIVEFHTINTVYNLWKLYGGEYSMSKKDGLLVYSDSSIETVAQYMNNVGVDNNTKVRDKVYNQNTINQPLKNSVISLLANKSAVKNGATNVNPSKLLDRDNEGNLIYSEISTVNFGIQLDANHHADYSELTEMSQVISALSANGHTAKEALDAYNEIARIVKDGLKKTNTFLANKNINGLSEYVAKIVIDALRRTDKISLAHSIVDQVEASLKEALGGKIPLSNPNFFGLFTTTILSDLNRSALKRKYTGIGGVLNPSAKILQFFEKEDKYGNKLQYNSTDIFNNARKEFKLNPAKFSGEYQKYLIKLQSLKGDKNLERNINKILIQTYLSYHFANKPITIDKVQLFDTVLINGIEQTLLTPTDLQNFVDTYDGVSKIEKVISKPRDLKPVEISWSEESLETDNNEVKQGVDYVFEQNPELKNIGSQQQYSKYLDTIFNTLNTPTILYHGQPEISNTTANNRLNLFQQLRDNTITEKEYKEVLENDDSYKDNPIIKKLSVDYAGKSSNSGINHGIFLTNNLKVAEFSENNRIYPVLVNFSKESNDWTNNHDFEGKSVRDNFKEFKEIIDDHFDENKKHGSSIYASPLIIENVIDSFKDDNDLIGDTTVVFNPDQTHILGNSQDIEGFKEFVKSTIKSKQTNIWLTDAVRFSTNHTMIF